MGFGKGAEACHSIAPLGTRDMVRLGFGGYSRRVADPENRSIPFVGMLIVVSPIGNQAIEP